MSATGFDGGVEAGLPPVGRLRYRTTDPEEGAEFVRAQYTDYQPTLLRSVGFLLDVAGAAVSSSLGSFQVDRLRHIAGPARATAEPPTRVIVVTVLSGHWGITERRRQVSEVVLMPTWGRFTPIWDDIDVVLSSLDPDTVRRVGAELSGLPPDAVTLRDSAALGADRARAFAALVTHLQRDLLPHDQVMASPLVRAEAVRHLATTLLLTFPNTALDALTDPHLGGPGRVEPSTVRRAVEFIESHAHEPIGLDEIAAAAGLGVRGIQYAFRRHRDTTPLEYLRRIRLDRAHHDLQTADPALGATVAAIAARWGFAHAGRFSATYRRVYGRSPSQTLQE